MYGDISNEKIFERLNEFIEDNIEFSKLESQVFQFNIFNVLKLYNKEEMHQHFLSWVLNPQENHNLSDFILKKLIFKVLKKNEDLNLKLPNSIDIDLWNLKDVNVIIEQRTNKMDGKYGKIDILIDSFNTKFVWVIELKLWTAEHSNQLKKYFEYTERRYSNYKTRLYTYVTIDGDNSSHQKYLNLGYMDIIDVLDENWHEIEQKTTNEISHFISQYTEMVRRYIMKDAEIQEIARNIYRKHQKALDFIYENRPDRLLDIKDHFVGLIKNNQQLILETSTKNFIRFIPADMDLVAKEGNRWVESGRILLFEIKNFENSLKFDLVLGPGDEFLREKLKSFTYNNSNLFTKYRSQKWSWVVLDRNTPEVNFDYEDNEFHDNLNQEFELYLRKVFLISEKFKEDWVNN